MSLRPYTVARWGIYAAAALAVLSAWLGQQAGATLDFVLMRSAFVFVIVTALGFGAEAVLTFGVAPGPASRPASPPEERDE